jgi:hypothetical protein
MVGSVQDSQGRIIVADAVHRTFFLSHKFYNLVTEASNSKEWCTLIENTLDTLSKDVKERLLNSQETPCNIKSFIECSIDYSIIQ